ncbi:MAG: hypothetical protein H0W72_01375 [Planctomycetes bacterium]|nr:hypothetical protein [Planctomycetota bacterium]
MNRAIICTAILAALSFPAFAADDHAGHDHAGHGHGHDHKKAADAAGSNTAVINAVTVTVSAAGAIVSGKTVELHLGITPEAPAPKAVRAWIGLESGKGSTKGKAHLHGSDSHVDVEVPSPLPEGSAVWIQVDPAEGASGKASVPLSAVVKQPAK